MKWIQYVLTKQTTDEHATMCVHCTRGSATMQTTHQINMPHVCVYDNLCRQPGVYLFHVGILFQAALAESRLLGPLVSHQPLLLLLLSLCSRTAERLGRNEGVAFLSPVRRLLHERAQPLGCIQVQSGT